jgi:hypothetical protein
VGDTAAVEKEYKAAGGRNTLFIFADGGTT